MEHVNLRGGPHRRDSVGQAQGGAANPGCVRVWTEHFTRRTLSRRVSSQGQNVVEASGARLLRMRALPGPLALEHTSCSGFRLGGPSGRWPRRCA